MIIFFPSWIANFVQSQNFLVIRHDCIRALAKFMLCKSDHSKVMTLEVNLFGHAHKLEVG